MTSARPSQTNISDQFAAIAASSASRHRAAPQAVSTCTANASAHGPALAGSVRALETLGVWASCRHQAAPLEAIRIIDDTRRLIRAPEVVFHAAEIGLEAFGYNIENQHLVAALDSRAASLPQLRRIDQAAAAIEVEADRIRVRLADESRLEARLVIGADGRRALCREAAGIIAEAFDYDQAALIPAASPHSDRRPSAPMTRRIARAHLGTP